MKYLTILLSLFCCSYTALCSDTTSQIRSIFDDFHQPEQIVEVTLQFDCKQLIRQKEKQEKFPATMTYKRPDGMAVTRTIQVKSRGKSRLNVCNFPPLKLDFNKAELMKEGFLKDADGLKLVTHCVDNNLTDRQVLKELLVYKLYNIITEKSYNTQLLRVKYLDSDGALYADEYAFLLESAEAVGARLHYCESAKDIEGTLELEPASYNQMVLFEYMIGNVDWDIRARHNIKVFKPLQGGYRIVIPYDFDYSGVVSALYAVPTERVGQKFLGERVLFSDFTNEEAFQSTVEYFLAKEEAIMKTCSTYAHLEEKDRAAVIKYLNAFYDFIKHPKINSKKFNSSVARTP